MRRTRATALSTTTFLALVTALGCGGDAPAEEPTAASPAAGPVAPTGALVSLSDAERERVPQVLAEVRNGRFSRAVVIKDNATIFLSLAETASDPAVASAALMALTTTWTHTPRYAERLQLLTDAYPAVILRRLDDPDPRVQAAAIKAAIKCILGESPHPEVVAALVRLASSHPSSAGRHEALEALWNSSAITSAQDQMAPYVAALDAPEAWVVSGSLFRLGSFGARFADQARLREKLVQLLAHADPGVRGRAAMALSSIVGAQDAERDRVALAILPLLEDTHAYPRSAAATALGWLDYRPAVHAIVPLLADTATNTYDIRGFRLLDGSEGVSHHDGSPWSRVNDAALRALQAFSSRLGTRITFDVRHQHVESDLAAAATRARAWYASVRAQLPPRPTSAP